MASISCAVDLKLRDVVVELLKEFLGHPAVADCRPDFTGFAGWQS